VTGLRERTRLAVKEQLADLAMALFLERGFEQTTVDDIARAAGISKRSFFRYFPAKEDVVFEGVRVLGADVVTALENRPADEGPWESLRAVLRDWNQEIEVERRRLIETTPALRARLHHQRDEIRRDCTAVVQARSGLTPFTAELITACAAAAFDSAADEWYRRGGEADRSALVEEAFDLARPACCP
jgi:AcrR family transcriptional regulator